MNQKNSKYINPLTDFGFKKLFGSEPNKELVTHFDKWLYVFTHLSQLQNRPQKLQERVFAKLFEAAEIAKFSPKEREAYEESLKYYRDIKNVVDASFNDGIEKGIEKTAKKMKEAGIDIDQIIEITGLDKGLIENL